MAISIDWGNTYEITVPQADLTPAGGDLYELDVDWFRQQLKALEASENGIVFGDTHVHNTTVTLGSITFARIVEILAPYTVKFDNVQHTIRAYGANHNIASRKVLNQASLITENSAGLITDSTGRGVIV